MFVISTLRFPYKGLRCQVFPLICALLLYSCDNNDAPSVKRTYSLIYLKDNDVYNKDNHAAFTGLVEYNGELFLAFREGLGHVSISEAEYGTVTIMKRVEGKWMKMWSLKHENMDLRDPYLMVNSGILRLYSGFNNFDGPNHSYQHSGTAYADFNGESWTGLTPLKNDVPHVVWIWKIRQYQGLFYGVGYLEGYKPLLMNSVDGINWRTQSELDVEGIVSEADLCFMGDSLYICLRKDVPTGAPSYWGRAKYPFNVFDWKVMDKSIACPEFFSIEESNQMWITGREYVVNDAGSVIRIQIPVYEVDVDGSLTLVKIVNESDIWDTGYPSFCKVGNTLNLSYYQVTDADYSKSVIRMAEFSINMNEHYLTPMK